MAPLTKAAAPLVRNWTRHALPSVRPSAASLAFPRATAGSTQQTRGRATEVSPNASAFDSPFHRSGGTARTTTDVPSFGNYKSSSSEVTNRVVQYFMVGSLGAITAMGAKATVQGKTSFGYNFS